MKTLIRVPLITLALALGSMLRAAETAPKPFPASLKTCVVSEEKLGEHGKPYIFVHENQEVKLCCKACLKDFNKEPGKYIKTISDAAAKQ